MLQLGSVAAGWARTGAGGLAGLVLGPPFPDRRRSGLIGVSGPVMRSAQLSRRPRCLRKRSVTSRVQTPVTLWPSNALKLPTGRYVPVNGGAPAPMGVAYVLYEPNSEQGRRD